MALRGSHQIKSGRPLTLQIAVPHSAGETCERVHAAACARFMAPGRGTLTRPARRPALCGGPVSNSESAKFAEMPPIDPEPARAVAARLPDLARGTSPHRSPYRGNP
jgi:hypothetical protein